MVISSISQMTLTVYHDDNGAIVFHITGVMCLHRPMNAPIYFKYCTIIKDNYVRHLHHCPLKDQEQYSKQPCAES